ncbi:MAG TPA: GMC family oxidoreductase [Propylenella sp.]|nr:GMC family oxidoreductase [Propylenella sp.]
MTKPAEEEFDVCVVGSGPAGAIAAWALSDEKLSVAVVEQGRTLEAGTDFDTVLSRSEKALARLENGAWAAIGYPWTSCNVGGGTVFWGAAAFRLRAIDHDARRHLAGADLDCRWPVSPGALRPHYDRIEELLGLAGPPCFADPTHPGGHAPPLPPIAPSPQARRLFDAGRQIGLSPFATPMLIATRPYRGRPACGFCSPCIEHRCESGAKADTYRILVAPRIATGQIQMLEGQKAVRLLRAAGRRIGALELVDVLTGEWRRVRAKSFVLAANAIQTAALLLRSGDQEEPQGLGNGAGLVGRGLCMKLNAYVNGYPAVPMPELAAADPWASGVGPFSTLAVTDYYEDSSCPTGLGGLIYEARHGWRYGCDPREDVARLECLLADTPSAQNRVRLSAEKDRFGVPLTIIDYRAHPRDLARLAWLVDRARRLLAAGGFEVSWEEPGGFALGSSHLHGTCRAGREPASSVVHPSGRIHSLENVFVADGSYMPFPGGVNPTLTIKAVASMVATYAAGTAGCDTALEAAE